MNGRRVAVAMVMAMVWTALAATPGAATEVRFFRQQNRADFTEGEFDGLALDGDGALRPAAHFATLASLDEPYVYVAVPWDGGWALGTGSEGRVVGVSRGGEVSTLATAAEPEIFALWPDADGTLYVGSSPNGKVYALRDGALTELFDPDETYIWAIARAPWGDLLVATGDAARLYALEPDGEARLLFASDEAHLRSLHPLAESVLIGTVGDGLVLSIDADGKVRTLFDAEQDEVLAFAGDGSGGWYAAAVASDASFTQQARERAKAGSDGDDDDEVIVEVEPSTEAAGNGEIRSEILRSLGGGEVRSAAVLQSETVHSLGWVDGRLWIGTGAEGNVYSLVGGKLALEAGLDDRQVVGVFADRGEPVLVTTNAAAVYRAAAASDAAGSYVSDALDAGAISRFGSLRWYGAAADEDGVRFQVRSGSNSKPDATWSEWSPATGGRDQSLSGVPLGRFVQWRLELRAAAGDAPRVTGVEISYRQNNGEPVIRSFTAMDPGQVLVPASFNPGDQVYEPVNPDREGIFTSLAPESPAANGRLKALWRIGFLTLRWEAQDPNDDSLAYDLDFRRDGASGAWLPVAENLRESYYSFDATVLPDGVHRFRLRASDRPGNTADTTLEAEEISPPVVIDHSAPRLVAATRDGSRIEAEVEDALSPIRRAEISIDAGEWGPVTAADGLLDGRHETLRVEVPPGAELVLLRVMDAAFNGATFDLLEETP
jgi:hypothetical protein